MSMLWFPLAFASVYYITNVSATAVIFYIVFAICRVIERRIRKMK